MEVRVKKIVGEQWTCTHKVFSCWDPWHDTVSLQLRNTNKQRLSEIWPRHFPQMATWTHTAATKPQLSPDSQTCTQCAVSPWLGCDTQTQRGTALTRLPCKIWFWWGPYDPPVLLGCGWHRAGSRGHGAVSRGQRCHKDLHGQHTALSKRHGSGGSPSSDALSPPVSLHLMASVGIFMCQSINIRTVREREIPSSWAGRDAKRRVCTARGTRLCPPEPGDSNSCVCLRCHLKKWSGRRFKRFATRNREEEGKLP